MRLTPNTVTVGVSLRQKGSCHWLSLPGGLGCGRGLGVGLLLAAAAGPAFLVCRSPQDPGPPEVTPWQITGRCRGTAC